MSNGYLPTTDSGLLEWVLPFSAKLSATPVAFGQTTQIADDVADKVSAYQSALATATDPLTKGSHATTLKNLAKTDLVAYVRHVAQDINNRMSTTDAQRSELGLRIKDSEPSPRPAPSTAPQTSVVSVSGRIVRLRLRDALAPTSRAKPFGCAGAVILTCVGEDPLPLGDPGWAWEGVATRTLVNVQLANSVPGGARVWIVCYWIGTRGEAGPPCEPISTYVQAQGTEPEAQAS